MCDTLWNGQGIRVVMGPGVSVASGTSHPGNVLLSTSLYIAIYRRAPFQYIGCGTRPLREPWSALDSLGHSRLGTCIPIHRPVFAYVLQLLIIRRSSVDRTGPVHRCFIPSYHQCRRHAGLDGGRDADGVREAAQVYRQGDQVAGGR